MSRAVLPPLRRHLTGIVLLSAWYLVLGVASAPHLVHHLFDPDGGADCAFLDAAHHAPAALSVPVLVPRPVPTLEPSAVSREPVHPSVGADPPPPRGPPAALLAST